MDNTNHPHSARHEPAPPLTKAGAHALLADVLRFGPAPNASREAFVTVVNLVLVGVLLAVLAPETVVAAVVAGVVLVFSAVRWIVGSRRWSRTG